MAVDYFTKWAEAKALTNIRDMDVKKFVWKNIVTRFGVPDSLISDNGLQFDSKAFRAFCSDHDIKDRYSTPAYPQRNGQAEATNKAIMNGLKKRLDGAKTVIPTEVNLCRARVVGFDPAQSNELMVERLNWLKECREAATIRLAKYQQKLARRYNRDVKIREFNAKDLLLRKAVGNMRDTMQES